MENVAYNDIRDLHGREEFLRPEAKIEAALLRSMTEQLADERRRLAEIEKRYTRHKSNLSWIHCIAYSVFGLAALALFTISALSLMDGLLEGQWILSPSASVLGIVAGLGLSVEIFIGFLIDLGFLRKDLILQQITVKGESDNP